MQKGSGAVRRLLLATAAWGLSFSTGKAVMMAQALMIPGRAPWFHSALILFVRMALATLVMAALFHRHLRALGGREVQQGVLLGLFGGVGMLLQTDAQHFLPASTSAFFTQFTCVFVPVAVAFRSRTWPALRVVCSCIMVMAGCAVLGDVSPAGSFLGRGEWETVAAAALFTGQILVLETPKYRHNEMRAAATVMFAVKALVLLPVILWGTPEVFAFSGDWGVWEQVFRAFSSGPVLLMTAMITLFSTVYGYATMTQWQPWVSPVQAGLIYATEPLFATLWALFLPGWFSTLSGIDYPNETLSVPFFMGAVLILGANLLVLERKARVENL